MYNYTENQLAATSIVMKYLNQQENYNKTIDLYNNMGAKISLDNEQKKTAFIEVLKSVLFAFSMSKNRKGVLNTINSILSIQPGNLYYRNILAEDFFNQLDFWNVLKVSGELLDDPDNTRSWRSYMRYLYALGQTLDRFSNEKVDEAVIRWHKRHIAGMVRKRSVTPPGWDGKRPLRLGMLHNFFHFSAYHPGLVKMFGVMREKGIELFAYDETIESTKEIPKTVIYPIIQHWRATKDLSNETLFEQIQADKIDILANLDGFFPKTRFHVFAMRPAPVNLAWHNTGHSMGEGIFDFMIADPIVMSDTLREQFSEVILDIPPCYFGYNPSDRRPDCELVPPSERNGRITFGVFNRPLKYTPHIMKLWARLLEREPDAQLLFSNSNLGMENLLHHTKSLLHEAGIGPDRYRIVNQHVPKYEYVARYRDVDVSLDTLPFTGGFTTGDSLWQGVPVITWQPYPPANWACYITSSMLIAAGLEEMIASDEDDYIEKAISFANDKELLRSYRATLRDKVAGSRLADVGAIGGDMAEALHRAMRITQYWTDQGIIDAPIEVRRTRLVD